MESLARALPDRFELPVVVMLAFGSSILTSLVSIWISLPPYVVDDATLAGATSTDLLILAALGLFLALRGWRPSQLGLVRPRWSDLASGLGLFVLTWSAMLAMHVLLDRIAPAADWSSPISGFRSGLGPTLLFFVLNSLIEEVFVNGYVLARLAPRGRAISIAVSTAIRVSYHLYQGPGAALLLVPMGLIPIARNIDRSPATVSIARGRRLLPLGEKVPEGRMRGEGVQWERRSVSSRSAHTPHPGFAHLLPQGEKGMEPDILDWRQQVGTSDGWYDLRRLDMAPGEPVAGTLRPHPAQHALLRDHDLRHGNALSPAPPGAVVHEPE